MAWSKKEIKTFCREFPIFGKTFKQCVRRYKKLGKKLGASGEKGEVRVRGKEATSGGQWTIKRMTKRQLLKYCRKSEPGQVRQCMRRMDTFRRSGYVTKKSDAYYSPRKARR